MRKLFGRMSILSVAVICGTMMSACGGGLSIEKPSVSSYGNVMFWEEVEGADSYLIDFGTEQEEVYSNYYIAERQTSNTRVGVRAKVGEKVSRKSNEVSLIKTDGFSVEETYKIELTDGKIYDIRPEHNFVQISGSALDSQIIIQSRSRDLVIELNSVTLSSKQGEACVSTADGVYDSSRLNFTVVFIVNGSNTISGSNFTKTPSKQATNSGKKGTRGGDGGSGLIAPNVVMTGSGALTIRGGDGGNGGDGADSAGWSTASYGNGGDGGDGGSGVLSTNFIVAMDIGGVVKTYGGNGGTGGHFGSNGSIVSGPLESIANNFKNGAMGSVGNNYRGKLVRLSGSFN